MRNTATALSILLVLSACSVPRLPTVGGAAPTAGGKLTFAAMGDMPYCDGEDTMLTLPEGSLAKAMRAFNPPVLLHFGDLKSGGDACTDELLLARREQMFALNPYRVVYTPGDNDWTDCDRENMSPRFDELERLNKLRSVFYQGEGNKLTRDIEGLTHQKGFTENAMWNMGGLVFGTLHIPGTNNGRDEILQSNLNKALDEADRRDTFNAAWVDALFTQAASADGLVITFQADIYRPNTDKPDKECTKANRTNCDGHKRIRDLLERKAMLYKKPVLLVHGDTSTYCLQKPAEGLAANLWRVNALGDFKSSDATRITFDPANKVEPFAAVGLLTGTPLPQACDKKPSQGVCK